MALHRGEYENARKLFKEGLRLSIEYSDPSNTLLSIIGLAGILGETGEDELAARLFGAVDGNREGLAGIEPSDQKDYDHYVSVVRDHLGTAIFDKLQNEGRTMTMEQAIAYALEETQ